MESTVLKQLHLFSRKSVCFDRIGIVAAFSPFRYKSFQLTGNREIFKVSSLRIRLFRKKIRSIRDSHFRGTFVPDLSTPAAMRACFPIVPANNVVFHYILLLLFIISETKGEGRAIRAENSVLRWTAEREKRKKRIGRKSFSPWNFLPLFCLRPRRTVKTRKRPEDQKKEGGEKKK